MGCQMVYHPFKSISIHHSNMVAAKPKSPKWFKLLLLMGASLSICKPGTKFNRHTTIYVFNSVPGRGYNGIKPELKIQNGGLQTKVRIVPLH